MTFNEVYIKHFNELRRFGRQLNGSTEFIEDLIQETFLRYHLELKKGISFENPRAWLYKVFLNLFKTGISAKKNEVADYERFRITDEPASDFQEEYSKNEKLRIVNEVLGQMEKKDKEILTLYNNGFSYAEMADILEINPNSVGKTLVRAIEKLKEILKIQYHEMFEQN